MLAAAERWGGGEDERPFLPRAFSVAAPPRRRHAATSCSRTSGPGRGGSPSCARRRPLAARPARPRLRAAARRPPAAAGRRRRRDRAAGDLARRARAGAARCSASATPRTPRGRRCSPGARVATDDGSVGHHGLVTELLRAELGCDPRVEVYACGPPPMLEAVRALCAEHDVPAQLALESGMACGFGACFGCVVPTRDGYVRLCVDGPVLDAADARGGRPDGDRASAASSSRTRSLNALGHVRRDRRPARVRRRAARATSRSRPSSRRPSRSRRARATRRRGCGSSPPG